MNNIRQLPIFENKYIKLLIDLIPVGYLVMLGVYLSRLFLDTTMWYLGWAPHNFLLFVALCVVCVAFKIVLYDNWTIKQAAAGFMVTVVCIGVYIKTGYREVLDIAVLIIGAKGISSKDILKVYFTVETALLCITVFSSLIGIVPELLYYKDGMVRHSFGVIYPTDFAAHVFYLIAVFICLKDDKVNLADSMAILIAAVVLYRLCVTETSAICLIILAVSLALAVIINRLPEIYRRICNGMICTAGVMAFPVFFLLSAVLVYLRSQDNPFTIWVDSVISNRLKLTVSAIDNEGIHFLGKGFSMIGGGRQEGWPGEYNFIDNSYFNILIRFGIILCAILFISFLITGLRYYRRCTWHIMLVMTVIAVHSFMEHHLPEPAYMVFIIMPFAEYDKETGIIPEHCTDFSYLLDIASVAGIAMTGGVLSLAAAQNGIRMEIKLMLAVLLVMLIICYVLYLEKGVKLQYVMLLMYFLTTASSVRLISGCQNVITLLNLNADPMHKKAFAIVVSLAFIIPVAFRRILENRKRSYALVTAAVLCTMILSGRSIITAQINNEEVQSEINNTIVAAQNFLDSTQQNINIHADKNAWIISMLTNNSIKAGQPSRLQTDTVYFADAGDEHPNFDEKYGFRRVEAGNGIIYYTNLPD